MIAGVRFRVASAACPRDLPLKDSGKDRSGSADRQAASVCQFRSTSCATGTSSMVSGAPRITRGWVSPDHANRVIADRVPSLGGSFRRTAGHQVALRAPGPPSRAE